MREEHIGVVSGLPDFVNFMAAMRRRKPLSEQDRVVVILFGAAISLPDQLVREFERLLRLAFPHITLEVIDRQRVQKTGFLSAGYTSLSLSQKTARRILYGAALQNKAHVDFYRFLQPDEFVFFDNGLSSYPDWDVPPLTTLFDPSGALPVSAYLSLFPALGAPQYLSETPTHALSANDYEATLQRLREVTGQSASGSPLPKRVIVGTSFFRLGRLSWEEERAIYLNLIRYLKSESSSEIVYKSHPRSSDRPLITQSDGVSILDSQIPLEAYIAPHSTGEIYSISSTSLILIPEQYGWKGFRIETDLTHNLFETSPQLGKLQEAEGRSFNTLRLEEPADRGIIPAKPGVMKFGVTVFGYDNFANFEREHRELGVYNVNVGDNMQSIAVRRALKRAGVQADQIINVNRDSLAQYDGPPVALVMNGVFYKHCFPIPPQVTPIFIGLHVRRPVVRENAAYFRKHQPIGCRDEFTRDLFTEFGIEAYVSGCMTLTFRPRPTTPEKTKLLIVHGSGAGGLPGDILQHVPPELLETAEFIYQRMPVGTYPLTEHDRLTVDAYARRLLEDYRERASLVLTPLHHAATPCMSSGIPVIIARKDLDSRFSFLNQFTPVYTPDRFAQINWEPEPVNVRSIRQQLEKDLLDRMGVVSGAPIT